jgi:hypothetical protein
MKSLKLTKFNNRAINLGAGAYTHVLLSQWQCPHVKPFDRAHRPYNIIQPRVTFYYAAIERYVPFALPRIIFVSQFNPPTFSMLDV